MITTKNISQFKGREGTITHRAANLIQGMEGRPVCEIISALEKFDMDEWRAKHGADAPAPVSPSAKRWIAQFAGLEPNRPQTHKWIIEIIADGRPIKSRQAFYALLKSCCNK